MIMINSLGLIFLNSNFKILKSLIKQIQLKVAEAGVVVVLWQIILIILHLIKCLNSDGKVVDGALVILVLVEFVTGFEEFARPLVLRFLWRHLHGLGTWVLFQLTLLLCN